MLMHAQNRFGVFQKLMPAIGKNNLRLSALKDLHVQLLFKLLDAMRDRWLGRIHPLGRGGKSAKPADPYEGLKRAQIDHG
jgi:hypothetical protein